MNRPGDTIDVWSRRRSSPNAPRRPIAVLVTLALVLSTLAVLAPTPAGAAAPKVQVGHGPLSSSRTVMAASGRNVYATWEDRGFFGTGTSVVRLARSTDRGETWTFPMAAGLLGADNDQRPTIAAIGDEVHVAWEHWAIDPTTKAVTRQIHYRLSENGGATFGGVRILDAADPTPTDSHDPKLAVTASGTWVTWADGGGAQVRVAVVHADGSADVRNLGAGELPSIAAQGGGVLVAFDRLPAPLAPKEVWAAYSADGDTFAPAVNLSNSPESLSSYPVVAVNDGDLHVAWHEATTPPTIRASTSADEGASFGTPVIVGTAPALYPWGNPSIAAYPGLVAVAWAAPDGRSVQVASSTDHGANFTTPVSISGAVRGSPTLAAPALESGPIAIFDWSMPERLADVDHDGVLDEHNDAAYISPATWQVDLDACASHTDGTGPLTFQWRIDDVVTGGNTCALSHEFADLGFHDIDLTVTQPDGERDHLVRTIDVADHLIVSIGDSIASGEGTPDKPEPGLTWNNRQCDRSGLAGPAQAALRLEQADRHSSVTFVHLACSGASITGADVASGGLLTPYEGINPGPPLDPQVVAAKALTGTRSVDALLVSIGANDAAFSDVVKECIALPFCNHISGVVDPFDAKLAALPGRYTVLSGALTPWVPADKVFISEYPDPTITDSGAWDLSCVGDGLWPGGTISDSEARWASEHLAAGLNQAVATAAQAHGWNYVGGISSGFARRGYCAADHDIVQIGESRDRQGDINGAFHPNAAGHQRYAAAIHAAVHAKLTASAPVPPSPHPLDDPLGDLYLGWIDGPKVVGTVLAQTGAGLAPLSTRTLSAPANDVGAGWVSVAATGQGAWAGWTEQTNNAQTWDVNGFKAFIGTLVQGPPNLRPTEVELVQGPSDPVALVAGRSTAIAATIESDINEPVTAQVAFTVDAEPGAGVVASGSRSVTFTPGENTVLLSPDPPFLPTESDSYSVTISVDPTNTVTETDEGDNQLTGATVGTAPSRGLKVVYVPFLGTSCPTVSNLASRSKPFLEGALPIPDGTLSSTTNCALSASGAATPAGIVDALGYLGSLAHLAGADVVVGVAPSGWLNGAQGAGAVGVALVAGGAAADPTTGAVIVDQGYSGDVVAHEILHAHGKNHIADVPAPGFWVARRTEVRGVDLMNPSVVTNPWLSAATYEFFRERLASTAGDPTIVLVRGTIGSDGTVTADPWYREDSILDVPMDASGEITLEYRDAGNAVLGTTGFDPSPAEAVYAPGSAPPEAPAGAPLPGPRTFAVRVPDLPPGTTSMVLLDGSDVLLTRPVTAAAPTNALTTPTAGASFSVGEQVEVAISAGDIDGGTLSNALFVSIDDGVTWRPLTIDHSGTSFTFPATFDLVSDQVRVRVVTTDGVRTATTTSDPFEITQDAEVGNRVSYLRWHYDENGTDEGLWTMAPDGSDQREVPLPPVPAGTPNAPALRQPDLAPDGSRIAFLSHLAETSPGIYQYTGDWRWQIWSVRPSGSELTRLTSPSSGGYDFDYSCPVHSPDGSMIAAAVRGVSQTWPYPQTHSIVVMDSDGSGLHTVVDLPADVSLMGQTRTEDSGTCPSWSPDGQHLAFNAHQDFVGEHIYTVDVDGTGFGVVWSGPDDVLRLGYVSWSSDGDGLIVGMETAEGLGLHSEVWRVQPDGSDPHELFAEESGRLFYPRTSPDATRIYASRLHSAPTYTADIFDFVSYALDGTDRRDVHATDDAYSFLWPDWVDAGGGVDPPPVPQPADAGGPYVATEDVPFQLDAGVSTLAADEVPAAAWDLDDDGQFDDAVGLRPEVSFPVPGDQPVQVQIIPASGPAVTSAPVLVAVAATGPEVVAPAASAGTPSQPVTITAGFVDPGDEAHTASIDWGDGAGPQPAVIAPGTDGGALSDEHLYTTVGPRTATIEVCDQGGPCGSTTVEVQIAASLPADLPPTAVGSSAGTPGGTPVWVPLTASDPEGAELRVALIGPPAHGTVIATSPELGIVYTPAAGFAGDDSFNFTVTDGRNLSAPATVTVHVGNEGPVAEPDTVAGLFDAPTVIDASVLLANDHDPDNTATLALAGVYEGPDTHGTVDRVGDTITYTPESGFTGTATFEYAVSDGSVAGVGSVEVDIAAPPGSPGVPLDVSAIGGDASADVRWHPPGSDGGSPLTGYDVKVVQTAAITSVGPAVTQATVGGLVNDTDYTFAVRARNAVGPGPWSAMSNVARPRASCSVDAFSDVPDNHPFCPEIFWMADNGVTTGYADGTFRPVAAISRQAMAAFLYRLAGSESGPDPTCTTSPFPDVPVDHTFCGEIDWMVDAGITGGYDDGTFRPAAAISRQAIAAFLYRMAGSESGPDPTCSLDPFSDVPANHAFCGEIDWMVGNGITGGYDDDTFRPTVTVSRQAMSAYLFRFDILTGIL